MKLQTLNSPAIENLEPMLNESIYHFLVEFQKGRTDFSELSSTFFRLLQTMTDPPLEFIWFYSAITFQTTQSSTITDSHNFILSVKDLFHSLISFQNPSVCSYLKQVSLVAPVLYQLVNSKFELSSCKIETEGLVDAIISHIFMCLNTNLVEQEVGGCKSTTSWVNVVPIWIADQIRQNRACVDGLQLFFPLSTDDVLRGIDGDCGMDYLAGVVMIEVFLFKLCLMFDHKDAKNYAAQIIKGFKKNPTFLVMLFKLLLESSLPVTELLTTTDEVILRRLLFDVVLDLGLFLSGDAYSQLSDVKYKEIIILWLFVTNSALQFATENGDHGAIGCYLNAFSESQIPHRIISWVTGVTAIKPTAPDISSPKDIIDWLLVLEKQGLKICDNNISELQEKAFKYKSMSVNNEVKDGQTRKRDNSGFEDVQKQIKVLKCCHENMDDGFGGKNEVGNSVNDQEMVDMVH